MISIIIPTYNRPEYLERILQSIVKQTYQKFEVIVINDHSDTTYNYEKVIYSLKKKFKEFKYIINENNKGAPYSRNIGIKLSKYDFISFVDDDDEWLPEKLEKQIALFKEGDEKLGLVYSWADSCNDKGKVIYKFRSIIEGNAISDILNECFIPSPSVIVKKDAILKAGLFDESMPSCQDWDMWTRILLSGFSCKVVKSIEAIHYKHGGQSIGTSERALYGYKMFYRKHFFKLIKYNKVKKIFKFIILILKK